MRRSVRADQVTVGDVVLLPGAAGARGVTVDEVVPRRATIKFVGRTATMVRLHAGTISWGWAPDDVVVRVRRARWWRRG